MSAHVCAVCLGAAEVCLQTARTRELTGSVHFSVRGDPFGGLGLAVVRRQRGISIFYRLGQTTR